MSIKFITEGDEGSLLLFHMVDSDQFFIDTDDYLCQKIDSDSYNVIASPEGDPHSLNCNDIRCDTIIKKILPKVTKIEFN